MRAFLHAFVIIARERGGEPTPIKNALSVTVIDDVNGISKLSSNPGRDCISIRANALEKGMNPYTLSSTIVKKKSRLSFSALG